MPIQLDLLAEQHAEAEARRRDPVKRAIWAGAFVVALVGLYSLYLQMQLWTARMQLTRENTRWQKLSVGYVEVKAVQLKSADIQRKLLSLQTLCTNRFLWANTLNALQFVMVDNIQLTHLRTGQSNITEIIQKEISGKPFKITNSTERIGFLMEGTVSGPNVSVGLAENMQSSIASYPFFQTNLDKKDGVVLDYKDKQDPLNLKNRIGEFKIECAFPRRTH